MANIFEYRYFELPRANFSALLYYWKGRWLSGRHTVLCGNLEKANKAKPDNSDKNGFHCRPSIKMLLLCILETCIIMIIIRKFVTLTLSHIKHESEARAVTRWPDGVC